MKFKLMGILTGNKKTKPKEVKVIPKKIIEQLKALTLTSEEDIEKIHSGFNSIQSHINAMDHQLKTLFHKGNVLTYKQNDSQLELKLTNGLRIVVKHSAKKDHHHYIIYNGKHVLVDAETIPISNTSQIKEIAATRIQADKEKKARKKMRRQTKTM